MPASSPKPKTRIGPIKAGPSPFSPRTISVSLRSATCHQHQSQDLPSFHGPKLNPGAKSSKKQILTLPTHLAWERLPETHLSALTSTARASLSSYPSDWPDLQYVPADTGPISANDTRNYVSVSMTLQKTTARGNVTINSTDTAQNPLVNTN